MIERLFSGSDIAVSVFFILIIYFIARRIQSKNVEKNPIYSYYVKGMMLKVFGSIIVCLIYIFYYGGGDTTGFYDSSILLSKLLASFPETYFSVVAGNLSYDNLVRFVDAGLCCPDYWRDPQSFAVVRIAGVLNLLSFFSFFGTSILFASLSFGGVWRLFMLFNELYKNMEKKFALAILYMPSLLFWGSGILKDTITFSAACWVTYSVYNIFIKKYKRLKFSAILVIAAYVLISIKPYILVALLPGSAIWISFNRISRIQNSFVRIMIAPAIIGLGFFITTSIMGALGSSLGSYGSVDKALNKAAETKSDLTREAYGKNSFDIGQFDGSVGSAVTLFPKAITAGLFRPFLWEARTIIILISALENTFLLFITLRTFFKVGPFKVLSRISGEPLLIFSFIFSVFFAFSVGLSTANFGALVRYKIPCIPFYLSTMFIIDSRREMKSKEESDDGRLIMFDPSLR